MNMGPLNYRVCYLTVWRRFGCTDVSPGQWLPELEKQARQEIYELLHENVG